MASGRRLHPCSKGSGGCCAVAPHAGRKNHGTFFVKLTEAMASRQSLLITGLDPTRRCCGPEPPQPRPMAPSGPGPALDQDG